VGVPWLWSAVAGLCVGAGPGPAGDGRTPEARAVGFLTVEVPRWSRENRCFSCHNNGDAARALYEASHAGLRVPAEALAGTTAWLSKPAGWDHNGGDGPFSDKRLARVAFAATLATATRTGSIRDRTALIDAAARLARDQADDGSWTLEGEEAPGSPAAYARAVATFLAREALATADVARFRSAIGRADDWLMRREIAAVGDASVALMAASVAASPSSAMRRRAALDLLGRAQSDDGGWGPYVNSPPEPFDTAIALLGLARSGESSDSTRRMIARGRAFLVASQRDDGGWPETTRPTGGTSYAQRISTTGWATLGLLATRQAASR
jgi:squalene cyclase